VRPPPSKPGPRSGSKSGPRPGPKPQPRPGFAPASRPRSGPKPGPGAGRAAESVYGIYPIAALLEAGAQQLAALWVQQDANPRVQALAERAARLGIRVQRLSKRQLDQQAGDGLHQGVLGELKPFAYVGLEQLWAPAAAAANPPLLLALDQVQDPHNVGSLIRTAYYLGGSGALLLQDRACAVTAAVHKTSAGAVAHLPIARVVNMARALQQLQGHGFTVVGSLPGAKADLHTVDLSGPTVWVVGSEAKGIRPLVQRHCDHLVGIPMLPGGGSLGAAAAGAICLYEAARQRRVRSP
jgi:23S rRNA (guanosine2251-2'-O)-methyltransferase